MRVHLVGVSGTGMGARAALLREAGDDVSGSDVAFDPPVGPMLRELGIRHVWLFRGLGSAGALCDEAVAVCREHDVDVIAGACPLMFLERTGFPHRVHRGLRRINHSLVRGGSST